LPYRTHFNLEIINLTAHCFVDWHFINPLQLKQNQILRDSVRLPGNGRGYFPGPRNRFLHYPIKNLVEFMTLDTLFMIKLIL